MRPSTNTPVQFKLMRLAETALACRLLGPVRAVEAGSAATAAETCWAWSLMTLRTRQKSPHEPKDRTVIFGFCLAPIMTAGVIANLTGIALSLPVLVVLNLIVGLAPIGCIVYELILTRSQQESVHDPA